MRFRTNSGLGRVLINQAEIRGQTILFLLLTSCPSAHETGSSAEKKTTKNAQRSTQSCISCGSNTSSVHIHLFIEFSNLLLWPLCPCNVFLAANMVPFHWDDTHAQEHKGAKDEGAHSTTIPINPKNAFKDTANSIDLMLHTRSESKQTH